VQVASLVKIVWKSNLRAHNVNTPQLEPMMMSVKEPRGLRANIETAIRTVIRNSRTKPIVKIETPNQTIDLERERDAWQAARR
jgi:hypothetical protein